MLEGTENERLQQAIAGDQAALEDLLLDAYDILLPRIEHRIPADLRGLLSAEDVLQEAFVDAVSKISTFKPESDGAFVRWVSTIADHRLIDLIRAQRAVKRGGGRAAVAADNWSSSLTDLLCLVAQHERTPSRSVARHEAVAAISSALEQLSPDYRDVLRLRYIEGLSVSETAERIGRSEQAVQMLCHRALRQLRDVLGPDAEFLSRKA
jgi:RNA polymerase sigma-70 factor (ECF subfamily)